MTDAGALRIGTPTLHRTRFPPRRIELAVGERHRVRLVDLPDKYVVTHYPTYSEGGPENSRASADTDTQLDVAFGKPVTLQTARLGDDQEMVN